jgi:GntR family transcriptional regulator, transcriptional repressor for pyruvate dehydrogenase complex
MVIPLNSSVGRTGLFQKVSTTRGFEDVVQQIQDAVIRGELRPGDRLPSQREFMDIFHVSRATILEALRVLETSGLIVMRYGAHGGAFISELNTDKVSESLDLLLQLRRVSIEELAEFRERVEGGTAYWAAMRATSSDLTRLEQMLKEYKEMMAEPILNAHRLFDQDVAFHVAVAEAAKNGPSLAVMNAIHSNMCKLFRFIPEGHEEEIYSDLDQILDSIANERPVEAESRMKKHIGFYHSLMLQHLDRHNIGSGRLSS